MAEKGVTRRSLFQSTAAGAGLALAGSLTGCESMPSALGGGKIYKNCDFYGSDQAFQGDQAKQAYFAMMARFDYPAYDKLKTDEFWVCDFLQRDFEKLGMGGIFWINEHNTYGASGAKAYTGDFKDKLFGYLGHEIYLLPGQMLPEHHHIATKDGYGPKMEAWHVRYGTVDYFGEYKAADGDETLIADMPADQRPWGFGEDWFKCKYVASRNAGEMYKLNDPVSWHFQRAGAEGAIVTEYATYHNHVAFSKPDMKFDNSKGKTAST